MDNFDKMMGLLSRGQFHQYVTEYIKSKQTIMDEFCKFVENKFTKEGVAEAEKEVDSLFHPRIKIEGGLNGVVVLDWDAMCRVSEKLFERARTLIAHGYPDIAIATAVHWIESFADEFDEEEVCADEDYDCDYDFGYDYDYSLSQIGPTCKKAAELLQEAFASPEASDFAKEDALQRIEALGDICIGLRDYVYLGTLAATLSLMGKEGKDALKILDELNVRYPMNSDIIFRKWELLTKMGNHSEAETLLVDNLNVYGVAEFCVNELYNAGEYTKLEPVLERLTSKVDYMNKHQQSKWLEMLAQCYDANQKPQQALQTYTRLFIDSKGGTPYYHELKKRVEPSNWDGFLKDLMSKVPFDTIFGGFDNKALILANESRFQELVEWLKKNNELDSYCRYMKYLPEDMQKEICVLCFNRIRQMLTYAKTRKQYGEVASAINGLTTTSLGISYARQLIDEIRQNYGTRPAFQEAIGGVASRVGK